MDRIQVLLLKHLRGELTADERAELFVWIRSDNDNQLLFDKLNDERLMADLLRKIDTINETKGWEYIERNAVRNIDPLDEEETKITPSKLVRFSFSRLWVAAAMLILIIGIVSTTYNYQQKKATQELSTSFGNIKNITLPDGSRIVLNSNSKITYKKNWSENEPRELWLDGEAFFDVKHLDIDKNRGAEARFIVHIKDIVVEVLGTSFDIRQRRGKTEVVLQSGKIKLSLNDAKKTELIILPRQMVSIEDVSKHYVIDSSVQAEEYTSWVQKKLILNGASLKEIVRYLEDNYGRKIVFQDRSLYERKIEGAIMLDNLDDALFALSKVLNVKVVKEDSTIFFIPK